MTRIGRFTLTAALAFAAVACGNARTPEQYSADTHTVLATKNGALKDCYEAELRKDKSAAGTVVAHFEVEPDSGKITAVKLDPGASAGLGACVTQALEGLTLSPADSNQGIATFTWVFSPGPTPPAPPAIAPAAPPPS